MICQTEEDESFEKVKQDTKLFQKNATTKLRLNPFSVDPTSYARFYPEGDTKSPFPLYYTMVSSHVFLMNDIVEGWNVYNNQVVNGLMINHNSFITKIIVAKMITI